MVKRLVLFLLLNFGALAIGGLFTGPAVTSDWYLELNKAPWTPPGWVFGAAWTTIMVCFSIYLALSWPSANNKPVKIWLYVIQWILNVAWNPVFFYFHQPVAALVIILALTYIIGHFIYRNWDRFEVRVFLLAPYFIWLLVASSLNLFIVLNN